MTDVKSEQFIFSRAMFCDNVSLSTNSAIGAVTREVVTSDM